MRIGGQDVNWRSCSRLAVACLITVLAAPAAAAGSETGWRQTQADDFTRYELLAPDTRSFRILYDVTATTPGAELFFNPIRPGSEPEVHGVTDLATGRALRWSLVDGERAAQDGWSGADPAMRYIRVELPRAVPKLELGDGSISPLAGEVRLRIDKTYRDPESYRLEEQPEPTAANIVFARSLGIRRNAVVLPHGWELVRCNVPAQIDTEQDGRLRLSFHSAWPGATQLELEARPVAELAGEAADPSDPSANSPATTTTRSTAAVAGGAESATARRRDDATVRGVGVPGQNLPTPGTIRPGGSQQSTVASGARIDYALEPRAAQDREIVYELQAPETHSFRLYHDYTERRVGVDRYLIIVRPGSRASDPEAWDLDTGSRLKVEQLRGIEISRRGIDLGFRPEPGTEVVVIWFGAVAEGATKRLRIEETYTDASRYGLMPGDRDTLLWDRSFGRPRNAVVLPHGWRLVTSSIPGVVSTLDDGRTRLDFVNDRDDEIEVLLRATRRPTEG